MTLDALQLLSTRASATKLGPPAPSTEVLESILTAALRAPDHGALRPYRIAVVEDEGRVALGELFVRSALARDPNLSAELQDAERRKALRAPMILVVACTPKPHPKVPEIEQILTAGCVAHAILLGLQAAGYGAMWRTGPVAYDPEVKDALGLSPSDHIVGFLYVGTPVEPPPEMRRPRVADHVARWPDATTSGRLRADGGSPSR